MKRMNTAEMTDSELRSAASEAAAHRRNADTDSAYDAWDARLETLLHEIEQREISDREDRNLAALERWETNHEVR